jgi:hypothetical protein
MRSGMPRWRALRNIPEAFGEIPLGVGYGNFTGEKFEVFDDGLPLAKDPAAEGEILFHLATNT